MMQLRNSGLLILFMLLPMSAMAMDFMDSVTVSDAGKYWEVTVNFSTPVSYVKHFPRSRGKILQMQIALQDKTISEQAIRKRETKMPAPEYSRVYRDVIYEGNVRGGPYLVIRFPEVTDFTLQREKNSQTIMVRLEKRKDKQPEAVVDPAAASDEDDNRSKLQEGKAALTRGEVVNAILIFSQLLSLPQHAHSQEAKEFLGLARERNGQLELAKKEYEAYLMQYGKTPRAKTVEQRLRSLTARMAAPKEQLKLGKRQKREQQGKAFRVDQFFGSWQQIAITEARKTLGVEGTGSYNVVLLSILNMNKRVKEQNREWRAVLQAQSQLEFEDSSSTTQTASDRVPKWLQVRSAYAEYRQKNRGWSGSVGRQSSKGAGVLQRFDGLVGSYSFNKKVSAKLVGGAPVEFSTFHTSQLLPTPAAGDFKPMFGAGVDLENLLPDWKSSLYFNQQYVTGLGAAGIVDRSAIGGDVRYFKKNKTFFALTDYDTSFSALNFLTLHYGWRVSQKTRFDIHFDHRFSPVLFTSNALLGIASINWSDPSSSSIISELGALSNDEQTDIKQNASMELLKQYLERNGKDAEQVLRQVALENTARSTLGTLGASYKINPNLQANGNIALSLYDAGAAIEETDPSLEDDWLANGLNYSVSGQLIWRNFRQKNDMLMSGAQLSHNASNDRYSLYGIYRGKLKEKWFSDVRLRTVYSDNSGARTDELSLIPSFKLDYRWRKTVAFDAELGLDYTAVKEFEDNVRPFLNAGYRMQF